MAMMQRDGDGMAVGFPWALQTGGGRMRWRCQVTSSLLFFQREEWEGE